MTAGWWKMRRIFAREPAYYCFDIMKPEPLASNRRAFLKSAGTIGAGLTILPSGLLSAARSPNDKLNIAVIGVGGRGGANLNGVKGENIVALCDVDANTLAKAAQRFPKAKTYADWRKCLEQKDIDAVVCSTTDHTHAFVNVWAMNRGMHVYCEKPLANSVHEARVVRETYLRNKDKLATQMGTQIHATDNYRRVVELIRDGAIGTVKSADVWVGRPRKTEAYYPAVSPVPDAPRLGPLDRPVALPPLQSGLPRQLPQVEPLLGLRHRPDRRHGQPPDRPALLGAGPALPDHLRGPGQAAAPRFLPRPRSR